MNHKATTIQEAARECADSLTEEDILNLRMHLDYYTHHFGFGLYLRNQYDYLLEMENSGFLGSFYRDFLGCWIFHAMLPLVFPEFAGYEDIIGRITSKRFEELNACYYLRYGRNFLVDVKPDPYFVCPESEGSQKESDERIEIEEKENSAYALAIAERIWDYASFEKTALALGYTPEEAEETHRFCIGTLEQECVFVPLEILFAKNANPARIAAFKEQSPLWEHLFAEHFYSFKQPPTYLFENREIVRTAVSINGQWLKYAPAFADDPETVLIAVRNNPRAGEYIDPSLWDRRDIAEEAARHSENVLLFDIDAFRQYNDCDGIVRLALEANGANICNTSRRIRSDFDFAKLALSHQRDIYPVSAYPSLSPALRQNKELVFLELQSPEPAIADFSKALLDDDEVAEFILQSEKTIELILWMSTRIQKKYLPVLPEELRERIRRIQVDSDVDDDEDDDEDDDDDEDYDWIDDSEWDGWEEEN